jgi:hypothetical protein
MASLHEVQRTFARGVVTGQFAGIDECVVGDRPGALARLQIYRNHYRITLVDSLAATFAVVQRLLGEDCFSAIARVFVDQRPPSQPCLFEYGEDFPSFLGEHEVLARLPYVADVARLEWALNEAFHAPDGVGGEPCLQDVPVSQLLANLPGDRLLTMSFVLHPSCRLVSSEYPIDRIWRANQDDARGDEVIDLAAGDVRLVVFRNAAEVGWQLLSAAGFCLLQSLAEGSSLGEALVRAGATASGENLPLVFAQLVDAGAIAAPVGNAVWKGV